MALVTLFFNLPFFSIENNRDQFSKTKLGIENMYNDISICFIIHPRISSLQISFESCGDRPVEKSVAISK